MVCLIGDSLHDIEGEGADLLNGVDGNLVLQAAVPPLLYQVVVHLPCTTVPIRKLFCPPRFVVHYHRYPCIMFFFPANSSGDVLAVVTSEEGPVRTRLQVTQNPYTVHIYHSWYGKFQCCVRIKF